MENVKITPRLVEDQVTADGIQQDEVFEVEFLFEDLVTDSDNNPNGVVLAGYTDVLFNPNLVLLEDNGIAYGQGYGNQQAGENRLSGINSGRDRGLG
jgi:hypothetical protein